MGVLIFDILHIACCVIVRLFSSSPRLYMCKVKVHGFPPRFESMENESLRYDVVRWDGV